MQSFLKRLRGIIKAGGGSGYKALFVEYGLSVSHYDFADTRWESLINAIRALAGDQTADILQRARERLETLAAEGDEGATEALQEPDVIDTNWRAIFAFLEEVGLQQAQRRGEVEGWRDTGGKDCERVWGCGDLVVVLVVVLWCVCVCVCGGGGGGGAPTPPP